MAIPLLFSVSAFAQNRGRKSAAPPPPLRMERGPGPGGMPKGSGPGLQANPNVFERLNRMNPQQRERALSKLPPERREKIEQGLKRYNDLPEQDRDHLRQQFQNFKQLPPEQQDALRKNFRQFTALSEDRRIVVRQELSQLRAMTPEQRKQRMDSEEFRSRFDGHERQLLDNFTRLMPAPE